MNRGVQPGVKVPCTSTFYGCQSYIDRLKELLPAAAVTVNNEPIFVCIKCMHVCFIMVINRTHKFWSQ